MTLETEENKKLVERKIFQSDRQAGLHNLTAVSVKEPENKIGL